MRLLSSRRRAITAPLTPYATGSPQGLAWRILYFCLSYLLICLGIALANRCKMPIVPTDLFPREFAQITGMPYSRVKIIFDVSCLAVTVFMTSTFLGHIKGLGIGTVLAAFTMGKVIGWIGSWMDRYVVFVSCMEDFSFHRNKHRRRVSLGKI